MKRVVVHENWLPVAFHDCVRRLGQGCSHVAGQQVDSPAS
jgi:hypothetical protein